ncbi:MAG: DUF3240 family protein [Hyphomicrobium sp.]|nr:DUF3240 family protein [Hyphomicrobium sp.]
MESTLCKITLVLPSSGAERVAELMLASEPQITGFTTWQAEGHGESFETANNSERVRGRVVRTVFVTILEKPRAEKLIAELREQAPIAHMIYWVEPVSQFGRMTSVQSIPSE